MNSSSGSGLKDRVNNLRIYKELVIGEWFLCGQGLLKLR
jgi:hypothetical protein